MSRIQLAVVHRNDVAAAPALPAPVWHSAMQIAAAPSQH